jgi:hypothetical protein
MAIVPSRGARVSAETTIEVAVVTGSRSETVSLPSACDQSATVAPVT